MGRRTLIGATAILVAIGAGLAVSWAVESTTPSRATGSTVDIGPSGDPVTAIRFDVVPEGTAPVPYVADDPEPGSRALTTIAAALPVTLPVPDPTPIGSCTGVAITFQLRSGRDLRFLPCRRPDVVAGFITAVDADQAG